MDALDQPEPAAAAEASMSIDEAGRKYAMSGGRDASPSPAGLGLSAALHGLAILAALLLPPRTLPPLPKEQSILVTMVSPPRPPVAVQPMPPERAARPLTAAPNPAKPDDNPAVPASPARPVESADSMIKAKEILSAKALADPRSRKAVLAMRELGSEDRIIQLCNVEAMEQVHAWKAEFKPDFVVAYAKADAKLSGSTLEANGGALRSRQHWYDIRFKCEVTPDLKKVVAFEFAMGKEIPRSEWEADLLPQGAGPLD